jgi:iron complex outermembrane receptor protein
VNPTEAIHFTVGGRYTHDVKKGTLVTFRNAANGNTLDKTWDKFNPMATLAYDVNNDCMSMPSMPPATAPAAPLALAHVSRLRSEIGMKSDFWDHRARFNIAGYIMDRKNSQVDFNAIYVSGSSNVNVLETVNVPGITKIRGVEADLTVKPVDGLTLTASYAYTYTKMPTVTNPFTGITQNVYIVFTPRNAASGSVDYEHPIGANGTTLRLHLDGNYSQATQTFDQYATKKRRLVRRQRWPTSRLPGTGQKMTVGLWGRNLLNTAYVYRRDPSNSLPGFDLVHRQHQQRAG